MSIKAITTELKQLADAEQAGHLARFFKTAPGQYGAGDMFRGIKVPPLRKLAKEYAGRIDLADVQELLNSRYHEDRMAGLFILVIQFQKAASPAIAKTIYELYLDNIARINNWDLVDLSCYHIVGGYLADKKRSDLYKLARHGDCSAADYQKYSLWANRIAIVSTMAFIRKNDFDDTLAIADILLHNKHDLIHKATGWLLREVGKRSQGTLEEFLSTRHKTMPRTMLRYAIERFPEQQRQEYLRAGKPQPKVISNKI